MIINRVQIKGAAELMARLGQLPAKTQKSILRPALRAGCKIIQAAAKAEAPEKSGAMKRAIKVKSRKGRRGVVSVGVVLGAGFYAGKEFYGAFQEFGWRAGPRSKSTAAQARRVTAKLRSEARARRSAATGTTTINSLDDLLAAPLAARGSRVRKLQEQHFRVIGSNQAAKVGDSRREIPGKHFMRNASERTGQQAADLAVALIRDGILKAAKGTA